MVAAHLGCLLRRQLRAVEPYGVMAPGKLPECHFFSRTEQLPNPNTQTLEEMAILLKDPGNIFHSPWLIRPGPWHLSALCAAHLPDCS